MYTRDKFYPNVRLRRDYEYNLLAVAYNLIAEFFVKNAQICSFCYFGTGVSVLFQFY
jgi:hypothetical protein